MKTGAITQLLNGELSGSVDIEISGLANITDATETDLVFAENSAYLKAALHSRAGAILAPLTEKTNIDGSSKAVIFTDSPRNAFITMLETFAAPIHAPDGIHPSAVVSEGCKIGAGVRIGAFSCIGTGSVIGDNVTILTGVQIAENCRVDSDTVLFPNVVLYPDVSIGKRCRIHSGTVLGADGFGYVLIGQGLRKVPQLGGVLIEDDVEIGANCCVDRAKTGKTVIGAGTKIDNLVQIGHNVQIGKGCIIVAMSGVAGSARLGNGVMLGGQSGIVEHGIVGDGARIAARSCPISEVAPGETILGFPGRPYRERMREFAATAALPAQVKKMRSLEKRLSELEAKLASSEKSDNSE